ncbi:MAG: alanyl-tRNA editing protein, partial [Bacillota bacterium]|nr:alanyl-tRNA editing protein [Bacillota bacterium]
MKNKIFYRDAYICNFTSKIVKQAVDEDGRVFVVLEETAFYPTGGGQPHDVGTLNGIEVEDVEEIDGEIRHYVKMPLSEVGADVLGAIDWERRFDHMQQHSGQHILSAAFERLFNMKTLSFHLGKEVLTIDLGVEKLTEEDAWQAEELANRIILENRTIESKWVTEQELENYHLRKKIAVTDNIRLVIIPDFDDNGCGGTHPDSTGQVAAIKILDWEKQKNNTRLRFICGSRVRKQLYQKQEILTQLSPLLNAPEETLVSAVRRQLEVVKDLEKALDATKETLLRYEASECLKQS